MFSCLLTVRIGDINYGQHLGHDRLITLLHQARLEFLHHLGGTELSVFGVGLIMRHLTVDYVGEAFLGDTLQVQISVHDCRQSAFTLHYRVCCGGRNIAQAYTQMVGFDYAQRKIRRLPAPLLTALTPYLATYKSV